MPLTDTAAGTSRLSAAGLSLGYAERPVVADLILVVPDGMVTVIVGANGCGKSTLLRGLARLLKPASGAVLPDGHSIHHSPAARPRRPSACSRRTPSPPRA